MRKKLLILCVAIIVMASGSLSVVSINNQKALIQTDVEALAGPEGCTINPEDLKGVCRKNANGIEFNCVEASWWQSKNCTSD